MLRLRQIKVSVKEDEEVVLLNKIAKRLNIKPGSFHLAKIVKKSLDARDKKDLHYVYEVDVSLDLESLENKILRKKIKDVLKTPYENYEFTITGAKELKDRPIIVGTGPAGLFAAYILAYHGYHPLVIERGERIEERVKTVKEFWQTGKLNPSSNVQFGEGGAGTFSDGKLNTLVKDVNFRGKKVFEIFVENGAPKEILYENKPHIGTDLLRQVIKNIREKIISFGGEIRYNTTLTDLIIDENNTLKAIEVNKKTIISCEALILAIGHSARDTFKLLYDRKLKLTAKPFAIGVRIEHPQKFINISQYGKDYASLKPASYKLTTNVNNRGVYTFCMCPGGYVVNASSCEKALAINGMSNHARDTANANSAVLVTVSSKDFGTHPLAGVEYQKKIEEKAYQITQGAIPQQLFKDFVKNQESTSYGQFPSVSMGRTTFANLNAILPSYVCESLKVGINNFGLKIKGFNCDDAILSGVETRSSSPLRIERDQEFQSNIRGIFPCGEGAGYAGGITTSAMDGLKVAEALAKIYTNH